MQVNVEEDARLGGRSIRCSSQVNAFFLQNLGQAGAGGFEVSVGNIPPRYGMWVGVSNRRKRCPSQVGLGIKAACRQFKKNSGAGLYIRRGIVGLIKSSSKKLTVQLLQLGKLKLPSPPAGQLAELGGILPAGIDDRISWKWIFHAQPKILAPQDQLIVLQVVAHQPGGLGQGFAKCRQGFGHGYAFLLGQGS